MDKKYILKITGQNISFLLVILSFVFSFMFQMVNILSALQRSGTIDYFNISVLALKIGITNHGIYRVYIIYNYPFIPIVVGLIYNIFIMTKNNAKIIEKK